MGFIHTRRSRHFYTAGIHFSILSFWVLFITITKFETTPFCFIMNRFSSFFQIPNNFDYSLQQKTIEYFSGLKNKSLLCNINPDKSSANSIPRDVLISCAFVGVKNFVLFQKTLRSTGCNASLVIFFDRKAYESLDYDTIQFTKDIGTQIILVPNSPCQGVYNKNYATYIFLEFLRENQYRLNRVIFCDLFDTLFQEDPFNTYMPKYALHLVHENILQKK